MPIAREPNVLEKSLNQAKLRRGSKIRGLTSHLEHEHEKASLKYIIENKLAPNYHVPGTKPIKKVARRDVARQGASFLETVDRKKP
jgi:hypothetical protein